MGSKTEVGFRPVQGQSQLSRQSQVGRKEGPGIREGASVWTRACSCCRSELTVGQRDALPAQGTGQVAKEGQLRQQVRRPDMGTRW